jgi:hypothetical protein
MGRDHAASERRSVTSSASVALGAWADRLIFSKTVGLARTGVAFAKTPDSAQGCPTGRPLLCELRPCASRRHRWPGAGFPPQGRPAPTFPFLPLLAWSALGGAQPDARTPDDREIGRHRPALATGEVITDPGAAATRGSLRPSPVFSLPVSASAGPAGLTRSRVRASATRQRHALRSPY